MKNGYKIDVVIALKTIPLAPKSTIIELIINIPNKKAVLQANLMSMG